MQLLIATDDGVVGLPGLEGRAAGALATEDGVVWAVVGGRDVWRHERSTGWWHAATAPDGLPDLTCIAAAGGELLVGTAEAHVARLDADAGGLVLDETFDALPERAAWYTPWGGPPDTRSLARDDRDGATLVNIHVGGVARHTPSEGWHALVDIDVDVHQVIVAPDGSYLVATGAAGFGRSTDQGRTWQWDAEGLHGSYCRAVAVTGNGEHVLLTASTGPSSGASSGAVYRRPLGSTDAWERVTPMVDKNVDTGWLAGDVDGKSAAFATWTGEVFVSTDAGATWDPSPRPPAAVRAVLFV